MKILSFESREEWLNARLGLVTGSELKKCLPLSRGDGIPAGVYERVSESLIASASINDDENPMSRGHRLEPEAVARFEAETGKKVDGSLVMWVSDEDNRMAVSPDGSIGKTEAVEVKCLGGAKHVEALYTRKIPKNTGGYEEQALQYFIVNEKLKTLYYVFYNPDFPAPLDYLCLVFTRKDKEKEIEATRLSELQTTAKVREIVNHLSMYSPEDLEKMREAHRELVVSQRNKLDEIASGIRDRVHETAVAGPKV